MPNNRVKRVEFEYPLQIERGNRTLVVRESFSDIQINIPIGSYFLTSTAAKPNTSIAFLINLLEVIQNRLNANLTGTYEVSLTDNLQVRITSTTSFVIPLNSPDFTFPREILGIDANDFSDLTSVGNQITFQHAPQGRWILSATANDDDTYQPISIVTDWRPFAVDRPFVSESGPDAIFTRFDGYEEVQFQFRRVPGAAIWNYKGSDPSEKAKYLQASTTVDDIQFMSLERFWGAMGLSYTDVDEIFRLESNVTYSAYDAAQFIAIKVVYVDELLDGTDFVQYRGFVTDRMTLSSIWSIISDDPMGGEWYQVSLPMIIERV